MDKNKKRKFKISLIAINEKLRKYYRGDICSQIKQIYENCNRELPEILRD